MQLITHYVDMLNTFLNSNIKEDVYIYQPPCFYVEKPSNKSNPPKTIMKLKKSIYGLRQLARVRWEHIIAEFQIMGFFYTKGVIGIYRKTLIATDKQPPVICLLLYVDDVIISAQNLDEFTKVKKQLHNRYTIKDLGPIKQFLNIQVTLLFDLPNHRLYVLMNF